MNRIPSTEVSSKFMHRSGPTGPASFSGEYTPYNVNNTVADSDFNAVPIGSQYCDVLTGTWYQKLFDTNDSIADWSAQTVIQSYDTGWYQNLLGGANADWANVDLGESSTVPGNVTHNLNTNLAGLYVNVLISTDGTDANSFQPVTTYNGTNGVLGFQIHQVDADAIRVHTGDGGLTYVNPTTGSLQALGASDTWYFRIVVYRLI